MSQDTISFDVKYLPTDILNAWKRASISSHFCSMILTSTSKRETAIKNIISTVINECIELSVKYGMDKTKHYCLGLHKSPTLTSINLDFYLIPHQVVLLKRYINQIKQIKALTELKELFIDTEFSELGLSIYTFIHSFNGTIQIPTPQKDPLNSFQKIKLKLKLNHKEYDNDY